MVTVLIADDHPGFRDTARRMLERDGFAVVGEAADGASGLTLARELDPDVILLDVALPDGSGFDVAERSGSRDRTSSSSRPGSAADLEVLELMAEGLSNGGICRRLFLSPKTVETHVNSIFTKLRLAPAPDDHRRVLAVLTYLRA
jgi:DNA-binding NarL/FixJ family response regulator